MIFLSFRGDFQVSAANFQECKSWYIKTGWISSNEVTQISFLMSAFWALHPVWLGWRGWLKIAWKHWTTRNGTFHPISISQIHRFLWKTPNMAPQIDGLPILTTLVYSSCSGTSLHEDWRDFNSFADKASPFSQSRLGIGAIWMVWYTQWVIYIRHIYLYVIWFHYHKLVYSWPWISMNFMCSLYISGTPSPTHFSG